MKYLAKLFAKRKNKLEIGQIVVISLVFATAILIVITSLVGYAGLQARSHRQAVGREKGISIAEAGLEAAIWKLNNQAGYTGESNTTYGEGTYTITVTNLSGSSKLIRADAYIPNASNPRAKRSIQVTANIGTTNIGFNYGVQVGDGGLTMDNNAIVNGNIYSNGNIVGSNGARINGDTFVADATGSISSVIIQNNSYSHSISNSTVGQNANHTTLTTTTVGGNVSADAISSCTVGGTAAYNSRLSCTVGGAITTPNTSVPTDPPSIALPIDAQQITDWESEAAAGGSLGSQSISGTTTTLGPKKIVGDLTITNNSILTLTGTVWVTGNITFGNNTTIKLSTGYGALSGVIIAGVSGSSVVGNISPQNNARIHGSGTAGRYWMLLSQKTSTSTAAINISNNASGAIFYAGSGRIDVSNNGGAKEITAYRVHLNQNAVITYETGLANANFTSGPGGGWEIADQTWQLLQ